MYDIARDLNGYIFGSETRFFGRNRPTSDASTRNLRFLTTEQVLADMAHLIDHIKQEDSRLADAKVILVGSLYAGNLATWFKVKYPHHVHGVWASSSYVEARLNFREFYEEIGNDLMNFGSEDCYRRTWRAFRTMENLIEGGRSEVLTEMFNLCEPLDVSNDPEVQTFIAAIADTVSVGIINGGSGYIEDMCAMVTNANITNDLVAFSGWFYREYRSVYCFETTYQQLIDFNTEQEWSSVAVAFGLRQHLYLLCTEYGWFITTDSDNQPFGSRIGINYYVEICRQVFGEFISENWMGQNANRTNRNFGGSQPVITNTFFTNGGLDPNRLVNVQNNIGATVEAQTLPRESPWGELWLRLFTTGVFFSVYGHSRDLYSLSENDSPTLRNAKIRARELITQWVENWDFCLFKSAFHPQFKIVNFRYGPKPGCINEKK